MSNELMEIAKFAVPLVGAAFAWLWNERRRRGAEEYVRKEAKYSALIDASQGFYVHVSSQEEARRQKTVFLSELNKCWLYCPDEVIRAAYRWLDLAKTGANSTDEQRLRAMGEFMVAVRKDMLSRKVVRRSELAASDFRHLRSN